MGIQNTPPASPYRIMENDEEEIEESELFEEDLEEIDIPDTAGLEADDEEDFIEGAEYEAIQDDAINVYTKHTGSIFCCHLDPVTGLLAVTGGEDDRAYIWETKTGNTLLECKGHTDSVVCAEFSRDGAYVATGDMSGVVQVWKLATKSVIWDTTIGDLAWLKWHHGTNVLLGGAMEGETYVWKIPAGDCKILPGHGQKSVCGLLMPDGRRAAVGYNDGSVKVFDLKTTTAIHHIPGRDDIGTLTCMDAHPDNNLLLASGVDGQVSVIKTQTGKVMSMLDCNPPGRQPDDACQCVEALGFCRDSTLSLAATGTLDGHLIVWDISRMARRHDIKQGSGITKMLWDRNTAMLYTAGLDGKVRRYDARSGILEQQWSGFRGEIFDICLSADGTTLIAGSGDNTARVFNVGDLDQ